MTNYREILRLNSLGISKQDIAAACDCSRNTVTNVLKRATECGLTWELVQGRSNQNLSDSLFPAGITKVAYKMPDYEYVHREMAKSGVTLSLLWVEYCEQCREAGEIPYKSTQFNKYYSDYVRKTKATPVSDISVSSIFWLYLIYRPDNLEIHRNSRLRR